MTADDLLKSYLRCHVQALVDLVIDDAEKHDDRRFQEIDEFPHPHRYRNVPRVPLPLHLRHHLRHRLRLHLHHFQYQCHHRL